MHTTIYYFSGTGNSLAVAKELAEKLGNCQLTPIAQVWQQDRIVADAERVGLVFPLYYLGLPKLVLEFVQKADFSASQYTFAVMTRGAPFMGGALHHLKQLLSSKSQQLQAGWYVDMPSNYIPWFTLPAEEAQRIMFQKASQKVLNLVEQVQRGAHVYERELLFWLRPFRNNPYLKAANHKDRHFQVENNCNSCGICQKVCPVKNITLTAGSQPEWQHHCQECLACLHACPQRAIQFGKNTHKRGRYRHPAVTLKELMAQQRSIL
jgi:formate hydrogenlyase subunit 6/NADH:ubiquinone oxidoreductase subunit I